MTANQKPLLDIVKYPILTEKTIGLIEQNQYSFAVDPKADKPMIKLAIEQLFDVTVIRVNTSLQPVRKRRVGQAVAKGKGRRHRVRVVPGGGSRRRRGYDAESP